MNMRIGLLVFVGMLIPGFVGAALDGKTVTGGYCDGELYRDVERHDYNNDEIIDNRDLSLLSTYLSGALVPVGKRIDLNGDDVFDRRDLDAFGNCEFTYVPRVVLLTSPREGEIVEVGEAMNFSWDVRDIYGDREWLVRILLQDADTFEVVGVLNEFRRKIITGEDSFSWTVAALPGIVTGDYVVKIEVGEEKALGSFDGRVDVRTDSFALVVTDAEPKFEILQPETDDVIDEGHAVPLRWRWRGYDGRRWEMKLFWLQKYNPNTRSFVFHSDQSSSLPKGLQSGASHTIQWTVPPNLEEGRYRIVLSAQLEGFSGDPNPLGQNASVDVDLKTPTPCLGDVNGDGEISIVDLVMVGIKFGQQAAPQEVEDVNADRVINIIDLVMVAREFGKTCPTSQGSVTPVAGQSTGSFLLGSLFSTIGRIVWGVVF